MRVVLDTNVLVRVAGTGSGPARAVFLRLLGAPHCHVSSQPLLDELRRVLDYPRVQRAHGLSAEKVQEFVADTAAVSDVVDLPVSPAAVVPQDPDDDPVVATAVYGRADVLCTLDRHLHRAEVVDYCRQFGIRILTDAELLAELRGS